MKHRLTAALAASVIGHAALIAGTGYGSGSEPPEPSSPGPRQQVMRVALSEPPLPAVAATNARSGGRGDKTAQATTPGIPVPRYYAAPELDGKPAPTAQIWPEYPESAARRHLTGVVTVRLFIDEQGSVESVEALEAQPPGHFEQSVIRAFQGARFTPGIRAGKAVKSQIVLRVAFDSPPPPLPEQTLSK
jgi:protein TonB